MNVIPHRLVFGALISLGAGLAACADATHPPHADAAEAAAVAGMRCSAQMQSRLYFGLSTPDGQLSEHQWQDFVDREISPRLPQGFTLLVASGQWRAADGRVQREASRVLEVLAQDSLALRQTLAEIAAATSCGLGRRWYRWP
jgi:Protein of unknown function (DUF3574)